MKEITFSSATFLILILLFSQCQKSSLSKSAKREMKSPSVTDNAKAKQDEEDSEERRIDSLMETPAETSVSGEYIKAFLIAYDAFKKDPEIPIHKRQIENYHFDFRQDNDSYFVHFIAKPLSDQQLVAGGKTELGREVLYIVRKKDFQITGNYYFK